MGKEVLDMVEQLLTAVASSAGVEQIFSTFGCIHSSIRNIDSAMKRQLRIDIN